MDLKINDWWISLNLYSDLNWKSNFFLKGKNRLWIMWDLNIINFIVNIYNSW